MARNESQGLQIAVILFTVVCVGLAFSTYMFYSSAETQRKAAEANEAKAKQADTDRLKAAYKVKVYEAVLGLSDATKAEIEQLKGSTGGGDATADKVYADFEKLMTGHEQAVTENTKGALSLPPYLIASISERNKQLGDSSVREVVANRDKEATEQREQARAQTAEVAAQKAAADLDNERNAFNAERDDFKKKQDELAAQIAAKDKQLKEVRERADADLAKLNTVIGKLNQDLSILQRKYSEIRKEGPDHEAADGEITWVNQRQRIAWINVGFEDGLTRQTTFTVFDRDENSLATGAKPKARIEVIRVTEPHLAECRILEDDLKNPILPGDKIFSPAWSPGQRLHFAIAGVLDLDGDGRPDNDEIRSIILVNGGVIDAELKPDGTRVGEITAQTRYLIRGKAPSERELGADEGKKAFEAYTQLLKSADTLGAETIDVSRFINLMGWKAQQRTTTLGAKRTTGRREFAPRTPGSAAPATDPDSSEAYEEAPAPPVPRATPRSEPAPAADDDDNPFG
jgi:hypothetical protein